MTILYKCYIVIGEYMYIYIYIYHCEISMAESQCVIICMYISCFLCVFAPKKSLPCESRNGSCKLYADRVCTERERERGREIERENERVRDRRQRNGVGSERQKLIRMRDRNRLE